jgi:hypothetical protein
VCYDIVLLRKEWFIPCPHCIEIPFLQLRQSSQHSLCPSCHVLFGALLPFASTASETVLATSALIVQEITMDLFLVTPHPEVAFETTFDIYDSSPDKWRLAERRLYTADLFVNQDG